MAGKFFQAKFMVRLLYLSVFLWVLIGAGCAVEAAKSSGTPDGKENGQPNMPVSASELHNAPSKGRIKIEPDSPADTVRAFYNHLREKRFRDALFLTNLRPAIEGLTDAELRELQMDFEDLAQEVPSDLQINGEIISGEKATVTAKFPNEKTGQPETQQIRLRREGDYWIVLTVDETTEKAIKKEGKNYFFSLKIDIHQVETEKMIDRLSRAQMIYALKNNGDYAGMEVLIGSGLIPEDVRTAEATGYNYNMWISSDKKKYFITAVPAVYGKTGKLSYLWNVDGKDKPRLVSKDVGGKRLKSE